MGPVRKLLMLATRSGPRNCARISNFLRCFKVGYTSKKCYEQVCLKQTTRCREVFGRWDQGETKDEAPSEEMFDGTAIDGGKEGIQEAIEQVNLFACASLLPIAIQPVGKTRAHPGHPD